MKRHNLKTSPPKNSPSKKSSARTSRRLAGSQSKQDSHVKSASLPSTRLGFSSCFSSSDQSSAICAHAHCSSFCDLRDGSHEPSYTFTSAVRHPPTAHFLCITPFHALSTELRLSQMRRGIPVHIPPSFDVPWQS